MLSLSLLLVLVVVCALAFDYINGFHDTANAIATVVSTRVLSPRKAIIMAACLNFIGALVSTQVAITVASGLVDTARFQIADIHQPAELAAKLRHPVDPLSQYLAQHLSPATQGLLGQYTAGAVPAPDLQAALVADLNRFLTRTDLYSAQRFAGVMLKAKTVAKANTSSTLKPEELANTNHMLLEKRYLRELGSNWQGFQVVILAAILGAIVWDLIPWKFGIPSSSSHALICGLCGAAIIHFAAEVSSAIVLFVTSHFGMPVSTTHVISGSIFDVGASKRLSAVRWGVAQSMVMAWILTLPAAGLVAALSYELLLHMGLGK